MMIFNNKMGHCSGYRFAPSRNLPMIVTEESFGTAVDSVFCCLTEGRCCLKYSPDGRFIYSVGADGNLAMTPAGKELHLESQLLCRFHMASVTCMDVCDRFVVTGSTDMSVGMYAAGEELKAVKALTRMSLPVRSVSIHPGQKHVACSGDATEIVIVDVEDVKAAPKVGRKHARPVSCLAYDPKGNFLASIDIAGELVIWAVSAEDGSIAGEDLSKVTIPAKFWPRLAWSPDGALLAVTGDDEIKLVGRDTWVTERIIKINDLHKECQDLVWGHDGSFLASHDASKLVVWNLADGTPCKAVSFEKGLFAVAFAPQDCLSEVLTIDKEGVLRRRRGCFQDGEIRELRAFLSSKRKTKKGALTQLADKAKEKAKAREKEEKTKKKPKKRADEMKSMERKYMLSEAEDGGDEEDDEDGEDIDEGEDDEGESIDLDHTSGGESGYDSLDDYDLDEDALDKTFAEGKPVAPVAVPPAPPVVQHPSFQPGATEPREDNQQRYLAWNAVGLIVSRKDEAGYNSIDIEFHDRVSMRPVRFTDDVGYTMAALSADGAVFASPGGEGKASTVHFMAFETWTGRQYWTLPLEEGERAMGVAIASNGAERAAVFVATSHGWLRSFSPSGLPGPTITFGHELVTMTAGAGKLLVVLNDRGGSLLTRCYAVSADTFPRLTFEGHLGRRADLNRLLWVGISETGLVGAFDQTGILYGLCDRLGHCWTPLGDFTSQLAEGQFVWPVFWDRTELTCILCKDDTAPPVLPRPIMTTLEIRYPMLSTGDDLSAQILGTVMKAMTLDSAISGSAGIREKEMRKIRTASDKHCLELIQLAVKVDKQVRALELCSLFYNEKSFELAYQLARHNRMATLADRIEEARDIFVAKQNNPQEASLVETPKGIPSRIDKESPSAILANLTPVQRTVADLHATEQSFESPLRSAAKRRIELVADHNDIDRIEEECRQARLPIEGEDEANAVTWTPREEEYLQQDDTPTASIVETADEKKPAGLLDVLGALSAKSAIPNEPAVVKAKSAAPVKENVQPNQTVVVVEPPPKKKQASLSSMFRKP